MTYYSRRQLEALGEPLGESVTQTKPGGHGRIYGGGGGGAQTSTVTQTNIPDWLKPQTEALLGAATQEFFTTKPVGGKAATYDEYGNELTPAVEPTYEITGIKPYTPYSTNVQDYLAGFSPLQQQAQYEAAGMQRPAGFDYGSQLSGMAGMGGLESAQQAYGYGGAGYGSGQLGQQLGTQQGAYYGGQGAGYGAQAAGMSPTAQMYGAQAAGTGADYARMATDPSSIQAYMSPYMQNVVDTQKQAAIRDYQETIMPQLQAQATKAGAFGGSRDAVQRALAQRNLSSQLQGIQSQGLQNAYQQAQQAQQFGVTSGLQGLQTGLQGLGQAGQLYGLGMQGAQTGLQGLQQQLAGTAQGMQGAQAGLQGVQGAQAGYNILGQAGTNLANIGTAQQTADLARMQFQSEQGAAQQAQEQAAINQAIQNYAMAQQYPAQQLAMYNSLLRGYATPTTTVSQYSAAPSPVSQLSGLATTAAATYGLTKRAGGKIKEKKYASGGLTDIDKKVFNDPTAFSPEVINKGIANDSINDMIGAIALNEISAARKKAQQAQAMQKGAPQGTILAKLQQQASGIDSLPTNLAPTQTMAGGGIVAFEDGGYVNEPIRFQNTGLVTDVPNPVNFVGSLGGGNTPDPKYLRAYYLSKGLPLPEELKTPAERAGSSNAPRGPASSMAELIGVDRLTAPSGRMNEPSLISQFMQRKKAEAMGGAPSAENPQGIAAAVPPSAAPSQVAASNIPSDQEGGAIGIPAAAPKGVPPPPTAKTDGGIDSILSGLRSANAEYEKTVRGLQGQAPTKEGSIADVKSFDEAFGVNRDYYKAQLEDLKKEKEDLKLDRETAANLRLLEAGLNIMAGESPHALVNIGKGASKALLGFATDVKDIKKQSRDLDKARRDLETAQQAAARSDSAKAQDRFQRAQELYQARELDLAKSKNSLAEKIATVKVQGMQINKPSGDMQMVERYAKDPEFRKAYDKMQIARQAPKDRTAAMKEWSDNILLQKQFPKFEDYFASIGGNTGLPAGVTRAGIR